MNDPSAASSRRRSARLELARADIGFSAAHFSIIEGRAERLHGHNYQVRLRALGEVRADGTVLDFHALKQAMRDACAELDEQTLLPAQSTVLDVLHEANHVTVRQADRRYVFPTQDVRLLPIDNTTCERLAEMLLHQVRTQLGPAAVRLELTVEELPGQGATVEE